MIKLNAMMQITTVILAGGQGRRMGCTNKALLKLAGKPLIEHVIDRIKPQSKKIIINANTDLEQFRRFGYPIIEDSKNSHLGPLLGIASTLQQSNVDNLLTLPCDAPFFPTDLVRRLSAALNKHPVDISIAHDGNRLQPLFSLMRSSLLLHIENCLDRHHYSVGRCFTEAKHTLVHFEDSDTIFSNLNSPNQLEKIEQSLIQNGK